MVLASGVQDGAYMQQLLGTLLRCCCCRVVRYVSAQPGCPYGNGSWYSRQYTGRVMGDPAGYGRRHAQMHAGGLP